LIPLLFYCFAEEVVNMIVEAGAVPALVKHLGEPRALTMEASGERGERPYEHEVEKGSAFALGLLAVKVLLFSDAVTFFVRHLACSPKIVFLLSITA
jgi:hypothetical protein